MSMNFGREQALLRQRLSAKGSEKLAAARQAQFGDPTKLGDDVKFLGAEDADVTAAAVDLAETYPEMGRAQMTAFVRTLWGSKTYELRTVAVEILAMRASLLEPPDLPFVEGLLKTTNIEHLSARIAGDVLGPLVCKNKKLWKDLAKLAKNDNGQLRRAAVRATKAPLIADGGVFNRFDEIVTPLLDEENEQLQQAIDEVLAAAAAHAAEAVQAFRETHGRTPK